MVAKSGSFRIIVLRKSANEGSNTGTKRKQVSPNVASTHSLALRACIWLANSASFFRDRHVHRDHVLFRRHRRLNVLFHHDRHEMNAMKNET